jgi:orotidine-5'-phosphate decarboxylase
MPEPRDHLVLALDVADLDDALALAGPLEPWFASVKIGAELFAAAGPAAFEALRSKGFWVFADLKLHDIPTTVERAAREIARHGVDFLNFHAAGGEAMLAAGVTGLQEGARDAGYEAPIALAVTVLTSDTDTTDLESRVHVARAARCDGVVCAGSDIAVAQDVGLRTMVAGIRRADDDANDQARISTPGDAIARGADWLVIGRTVTAADEPEIAAVEITRDVSDALARASG